MAVGPVNLDLLDALIPKQRATSQKQFRLETLMLRHTCAMSVNPA